MVTDQERHLVERLERAVPVRTKRMFGGVGVYSGELFFALIAGDVLYFKVDDGNRAQYTSRGLAPFQPFADRATTLSYYEVPLDVLDDARRLRPWIDGALAAARASKVRASSARKGSTKRASSKGTPSKIASTNAASANSTKGAKRAPTPRAKAASGASPRGAKIENLGPVSRRWLAQVDVHTLEDLEARGSVAVYLELRRRGIAANANLLFSMEAAILGLRWDRLPEVVKQNLRERAGIARVR